MQEVSPILDNIHVNSFLLYSYSLIEQSRKKLIDIIKKIGNTEQRVCESELFRIRESTIDKYEQIYKVAEKKQ